MNGRSDATLIGAESIPARDLRQRFQAIARLSKQGIEPEDFFRAVLRQLAQDVPACWSVAWLRRGDHWHRVTQPEKLTAAADQEIASVGLAAIVDALSQGAPGCHRQATAQGMTLLSLPLRGDATVVLQVALAPPDGRQGSADGLTSTKFAEELLEAYGQLSEDYDRDRALQRLRTALAQQQRLARLSAAVHGSLDLDRTAYEIVAGLVATMETCDRASLLVRKRRGLQVVAVSGVATLDHRAPVIRCLQRLAQAVDLSGEMLVHAADDQPRAPQLAEPLDAYLDWAHSSCLLVLPLRPAEVRGEGRGEAAARARGGVSDEASCGVLVIESGDPASFAAIVDQTLELSSVCAAALSNAMEHSRLPLRRTGAALRRLGDLLWLRGGRVTALLTAAVALIALLVFMPAALKIEATGTLQPARIHNAFAPRDGYVTEVLVEHDQPVDRGSVLLRLHSPDLELELRRTEGAIESTEMELRATEAARRRGGQPATSPPDAAGGFAADEARLRSVLDSYRQQLAMLRDEQAALTINSPVDGYVLSWQVRQTLLGRPVQRGQRLLQLAATDSQWTLALELPDRDAGHLLRAQGKLRPDLATEYILATQPRRRHLGRVAEVARITEMSDQGQPVVEVIVAIDQSTLELPRAGAQVRAEIDCGPHPLGYVWFHHLWDTLWSWMRF